jgi:aryl-alcohol dehydrogenase-like predicted oxidoreductase
MAPARIRIAPDYEISRVIRGGWQLADGHSDGRGADPLADMLAFADAGIDTFDCADIYTGVEALIGRFRRLYRDRRGAEALARLKVHTKFVPDVDSLASLDRRQVTAAIDRSLRRLGMERLDLVQFHWWDYGAGRWLEAAGWLAELQRAGKIHKLSGTNFDAERVAAMLESGVPLTSLQLQYSVLDRRPSTRLAALAAAHGVALFCYGTVAGGFLGERWLGAAEPDGGLENRSLVKYKLIIDDAGGWDAFQHLLATLATVAARHGADIATIASAYTLTLPAVAAVIVGARNRSHLAANLAITEIDLDDSDRRAIGDAVATLTPLAGDVYGLERDRTGRHGAIMKYNLNNTPGEAGSSLHKAPGAALRQTGKNAMAGAAGQK